MLSYKILCLYVCTNLYLYTCYVSSIQDIAHQCMADKLRDCSPIVRTTMMEHAKNAAKAHQLNCENGLEVCLTKTIMHVMNILEGDVLVAKSAALRDAVAANVTMYMLRDPSMANLHQLDNIIKYHLDSMKVYVEQSMMTMAQQLRMAPEMPKGVASMLVSLLFLMASLWFGRIFLN